MLLYNFMDFRSIYSILRLTLAHLLNVTCKNLTIIFCHIKKAAEQSSQKGDHPTSRGLRLKSCDSKYAEVLLNKANSYKLVLFSRPPDLLDSLH